MVDVVKRDSLIGLPVISEKNGRILGNVADILLVPEEKKIKGVVVKINGWKSHYPVIGLDKIQAIGQHAVIVGDNENSGENNSDDINRDSYRQGNDILGCRIIRDDGCELGRVSDILFDPCSGDIKGYEISKSVIDDLLNGRLFLSCDSEHKINEELIIISAYEAQNMKSCSKGIKNLFYDKLKQEGWNFDEDKVYGGVYCRKHIGNSIRNVTQPRNGQ